LLAGGQRELGAVAERSRALLSICVLPKISRSASAEPMAVVARTRPTASSPTVTGNMPSCARGRR
jgi:hypothetical protein